MASGIPTRRLAARRLDENAPPTRSASTVGASTAAARSKVVVHTTTDRTALTASASTSGIPRSTLPVMRRQQSASAASSTVSSAAHGAKQSLGPAAVTAAARRAALGEVTNATGTTTTMARERIPMGGARGGTREVAASAYARKENAPAPSAAGLAGKEGKGKQVAGPSLKEDKGKPAGVENRAERRPLAPQPVDGLRRGRSSMTNVAAIANAAPAKDDRPAMKRKTTAPAQVVGATAASRIPARPRMAGAASGPIKPLREKKINVVRDPEVAEQPRAGPSVPVPEVEPPAKRRKTLSPKPATVQLPELEAAAPISTTPRDEEDILADEGLYDEDGKEVVLSSGGHAGTGMHSPKRQGRTTARPKDHGWTDLDEEDVGDPTMASEYVVDAFNYMMAIERTTMANPEYMAKQTELQWEMRTILMDWIIEIHQKFRLLPETLFIAGNLVDRFLSARLVSLVKLQLAGLTALFVAAKYEEVICPSVAHFLAMTEDGFGVDEVLKAERYLLSSLEFDMSYPNPLHFLRRISKADGYDIQTRTVAKYLIEMQLVEEKLLAYPPSLLAAAGMWLARLCLDRGEWHANLVHYSTYAEDELLEPAQVMFNFITDPSKHSTSFFKKYAIKKHMKSSVFMWQWAKDRWPESCTGESARLGMELEDYIRERDEEEELEL